MSDDDAAPDDDLEHAFAELLENLKEQEEAELEADRLNQLKSGDDDYDNLWQLYRRKRKLDVRDAHAATQDELKDISREWMERKDFLQEREGYLFDHLQTNHQIDMRSYYVDHHIKPKIAKLSKQDAVERKRVDKILNEKRPQQQIESMGVQTFVASGASGYVGITDEEELAHVDVLDCAAPTLEGDLPADKIKVFSVADDVDEVDAVVQLDDTGANWFNGFRMDQCMQSSLKPHQLDACKLGLDVIFGGAHGILIAHGMGMGKTLTTMSILEIWSNRYKNARAIVCCPKGLILQWERELESWKFITLNTYAIAEEKDEQMEQKLKKWRKHGGVVIVGHDQFKRTHDLFSVCPDTVVVADEAHILKEAKTDLFTAFQALPTNRKIFLTGSPIQNHLVEYYNLIHLLAPGILGLTQSIFQEYFNDPIIAGLCKGASDCDIMMCNMLMTQMQNRLVVPENIGGIFMAVVHEQSSGEFLKASIPPKREFCVLHDCDDEVEPNASIFVERLNAQTAARANKINVIIALIRDIREHTDDNIIVFSTLNSVLMDLKAIEDGALFTGDIKSVTRRNAIVTEFPSKVGDILYMATKAGGVGLNLTAAQRVILADVSWNPVDDNQAIARAWRMGQKKPVVVYRLVANDTIEKGLYRGAINKHLMALHVSNRYTSDLSLTYTKKELYRLKEENDAEELILSASKCGDLVLAKAMKKLTKNGEDICILDHDGAFNSRDDANLELLASYDGEKSWNLHNHLQHVCSRRQVVPNGTVQLVDCLTTEMDGMLCKPHSPAFSAFSDSTDVILESCVKFDSKALVFMYLGPKLQTGHVRQVEVCTWVQIACPHCNEKLMTLLDACEGKETIICGACETSFTYDESLDDIAADGEEVHEGEVDLDSTPMGESRSWDVLAGDFTCAEAAFSFYCADIPLLSDIRKERKNVFFQFRAVHIDESGTCSAYSDPSARITFFDSNSDSDSESVS